MTQPHRHRSTAAETRFDLPGLVRLGLWGGAAAASLLVVALATQTERGHRRVSLAYGVLTGATPSPAAEQQRTAQQIRDAEIEAKRLTESLRNLSEDRDRLLARMTALERNYEDVTGSIGRLTGAQKPATETPSALFPLAPDLAPIASAPATTPAAAPPAPANAAAAPPAEAPETVPARSEFGVDLGGGPTVASLRTAWNQMRRNHGSLLDGLRPVIAIRDGKNGQVELRLVVGPIPNAANAARLCASLAAAGLSCQPTMYDGQKLALR